MYGGKFDSASVQKVITDEEFDDMLEKELKSINSYFDKPRADYTPTVTVGLRTGFSEDTELETAIAIIHDLPEDKKFEIMQALGVEFWDKRKSHGMPIAVLFTAEAFYRKFDKDEEVNTRKKKISDYEDKDECIITYGMTIDGRCNMAMHSIKRDKKGDITGVKLIQYAPYKGKEPKVGSELVAQFFIGAAKAALKR